MLTWAFVAHPSAKTFTAAPRPRPRTLGTLSFILGDASCFGGPQPHLCLLSSMGAAGPNGLHPALGRRWKMPESQDSGSVDLLSVPSLRDLSCTACYLVPGHVILCSYVLAYGRVGAGRLSVTWPHSSCLLTAFNSGELCVHYMVG